MSRKEPSFAERLQTAAKAKQTQLEKMRGYLDSGTTDGGRLVAGDEPLGAELAGGYFARKDWLDDQRFASNEGRVANRPILEPMIEAYFLKHTAQELLDKLVPAGMACAAAYKVSDVVANPHTKARGAVIEVDYPASAR